MHAASAARSRAAERVVCAHECPAHAGGRADRLAGRACIGTPLQTVRSLCVVGKKGILPESDVLRGFSVVEEAGRRYGLMRTNGPRVWRVPTAVTPAVWVR